MNLQTVIEKIWCARGAQTELAKSLGIGDRKVRHMIKGTNALTPDLWPRLAKVVKKKISDLEAILIEIEKISST